MIKKIICIGVIFVPFAEIIIRIIPYTYAVVKNTRDIKEILALQFALVISLLVLWQKGIQKGKAIWLSILVGYCILSYSFWFQKPIVINHIDSSSFWIWKPLFQIIIYFLMVLSVASVDFNKKDIRVLMSIMSYTGLAMAGYVYLQYFELMPFYQTKVFPTEALTPTNPNMVGNLGQPTLVAPFIAITVFASFYQKKWLIGAFQIIMVLLINSMMTILALGSAIVLCLVLLKPRSIYIVIPCICIFAYIFCPKSIVEESSGRFYTWKKVISEWKGYPTGEKDKNYSYFGTGIGSFGYLFPNKNKTTFRQAHCEPLEILYSLGLFGLFIYIMAILEIFWIAFKAYLDKVDWRMRLSITLIGMFTVVYLNSLGTFIFQLGVYQFLTALIAGLILNHSIGGEGCES